MSEQTVTTQQELDKAVIRFLTSVPYVESGDVIVVDSRSAEVLRIASSRHIQVRAIGTTQLEASGAAVSVEAHDQATVFARGATVFARDRAEVRASQGAIVVATGSSRAQAAAGVDCVAVGPDAVVEQNVDTAAERGVWAPQGAVLLAAPSTGGTAIAYPVDGVPEEYLVTTAESQRLIHAGDTPYVLGEATVARRFFQAPAGMALLPAEAGWQSVEGADRPVVVYSTEHCMGCRGTERELQRTQTPYAKIALESLSDYEKNLVTGGHSQAPVVFAPDGSSWSGHRPTMIANLVSPTTEGPAL